ncbi:MAG: hypothetical protein H7122_10770 [Chitinophagaceae bacterium]|nr:hypothetical protein [Chitinophagaceae bacterium]
MKLLREFKEDNTADQLNYHLFMYGEGYRIQDAGCWILEKEPRLSFRVTIVISVFSGFCFSKNGVVKLMVKSFPS